jgi:hypothetical protein
VKVSESMSPQNEVANIILKSVIRCPSCGFESNEQMPTDACQYLYECSGCGARLKPKPGDCCGLVRLFKQSLPTTYSHFIVYPERSERLRKVIVFRDWLLEEAAGSVT